MVAKKFDISKIQKEIDARKKSRGITESANGGVARDGFLNELVTSLNTGRETTASSVIRAVENKAAIKNGENREPLGEIKIAKPAMQSNSIPQHMPQRGAVNEVMMSPERDELMFKDIEQRRKSTLSESIAGLIDQGSAGNYPSKANVNNINQRPQVINEGNEKLNYILENFNQLAEDAMKDVIIEMYAVERIKKVLTENKEIIKSIVYETIRELQAKSKNKP